VDGAVWLEGTEGAALSECTFEGLGGNGVFLHGYNRRAAVTGGRFRFIGDSAIVSLGKVAGMDGSAQEAPFGTVVAGCVASELGLYTKQSGFYYAGLSGNATVQGNAFFNMPRAGVNINDGYAGGHLIRQNLGFNCVRESSDHGEFAVSSPTRAATAPPHTHPLTTHTHPHPPFLHTPAPPPLLVGCYNSWDRQPYIWNPDDITNLYPAKTTITQNVFLNNYHSTWPIDQCVQVAAACTRAAACSSTALRHLSPLDSSSTRLRFFRPLLSTSPTPNFHSPSPRPLAQR
jgi:hypothetical protein